MSEPQEAPTLYNGHVVYITLLEKKQLLLVKVIVDDEGPYYRKSFWVDQDNTPDWLSLGMAVTFWIGFKGNPNRGKSKQVAVNVRLQKR